MIDGAMKMPEPMTLPTMSVVASSNPSPRTRPCAGAALAAAGAREVVLTTACSFSGGSLGGKAARIGDPAGMSTFLPAQVVAALPLAAALAGHFLDGGGRAAELLDGGREVADAAQAIRRIRLRVLREAD